MENLKVLEKNFGDQIIALEKVRVKKSREIPNVNLNLYFYRWDFQTVPVLEFNK